METRTCAVCGTEITRPKFTSPVERTACSRHCGAKLGGGRPKIYASSEEQFWSKVDKSGECWIYTGNIDSSGHGLFHTGDKEHGYKTYQAHRYVWMITYGPIEPGKQINHHCDNPACVRPDHIYQGTQADNVRDMMERGRHGKRPSKELEPDQVMALCRAYQGGTSAVDLAQQYGISKFTVYGIVSGRIWKSITAGGFRRASKRGYPAVTRTAPAV